MNIAFICCLFVVSLQWYNVQAILYTIEIQSFLTDTQKTQLVSRPAAVSNGNKALPVTDVNGVRRFTQVLQLEPIAEQTTVTIQVNKVRYSNQDGIDTIKFRLEDVATGVVTSMGSRNTTDTTDWEIFEHTTASDAVIKTAGIYRFVMVVKTYGGKVEIDNLELELTNQKPHIFTATYNG